MSYSPWRYSSDFSAIQRLAGALKIEAGRTGNDVYRAYLTGGANALYMLAPTIEEPTAENVVGMMYKKADY